MSYLLFGIYFAAASFLIFRSRLVRGSGLPIWYWITFFTVKVAAGCYYGLWYAKPGNIETSDTWRFHRFGLEEYALLRNDPAAYFMNLFHYDPGYRGGVLDTHGYWNDLKDNLMIKTISLMDVLSGCNYYVNVVLYSFITFFGFVLLYLTCKRTLRQPPSALTTLAIFCTPSCLFWTSGLHKDGFMLLFLCILFWSFAKMIATGQLRWKYVLCMMVSFTGLFLIRNYVAAFIIPAFAAWFVTHRYKVRPIIAYAAMAAACLVIFFLSPLLHHSINLPQSLLERKLAFDALSGNSRLPFIPLQSSPGSYLSNLPAALSHSFLSPYLWQTRTVMEKVAAIENTIIIVVLFLFLFRNKNSDPYLQQFQGMLIFLCFSIYILIGYIVPFAGAIVRYRSVFLMLLLTAASLRARNALKII